MAKAKTIIDLLAEQPADDLAKMRESNNRELARARAEVARLELQEQQIELALTKRERGKPGRPGGITSEQVLSAATGAEAPVSAAEVHEMLTAAGLSASVNNVRNHLNRLVESGDLEKDENKKFVVPAPLFVPASLAPGADDDIPF